MKPSMFMRALDHDDMQAAMPRDRGHLLAMLQRQQEIGRRLSRTTGALDDCISLDILREENDQLRQEIARMESEIRYLA